MKLVISPEQIKALKESYENTPDSFEGENHHAPDFVLFNDTVYRWTDPDAVPFFVLSDGEIEYGEKGKRHVDFMDTTFRSAFDKRNFVDDIVLQGRYWKSGNIFSFWYVDWDYFSGNGIIQILSQVCRHFYSTVIGAYLAYKDKTFVVAKEDDYYWLKEVENTKEKRTLDQETYDRIDHMFSSQVNYVKRTILVVERFGQTMVPRELNSFEAIATGCYRMASDFFHNKVSEFDKEDFRAYIDKRFNGRVTFDELIDYFSGTLRNRVRSRSLGTNMLHTASNFDDEILDSAHRCGLSDVDMRIIPSDDGTPYSYNIYTTKVQSANRLCNDMIDSGYIVDRKTGRKVQDSDGKTFNIISFRIRRPAQLNESKGYDMGEIGAVNCTLDFDEDEYQEWLQDNGTQDTPENKIQYIKDYCTYYVEYQDSETFHTFDHEDLSYDEILETFGEKMGNSIINDCMDGKEHSFETLEYVDNSEVNLNNPVELNAAAKQVMSVVDNPCGKFRGWILSDGTTLSAGWDHNACFKIDPNRIKYREDFTKLGNIRFSDVSLEFGKYPTHEQMEMVRMYCEYHQHDTIYVDFLSDKFGRQDTRYNGMDFSDLSNDLYNYYTHGTLGRKRDYMYEGIDELDLYHGTHADFDQFKEEFYLTGVGEMAYGWGVYLSNSINTAKEYSPGGQIMTVEVPDGKYLDSRRISKKEASYLARAFYKFYLNGKGGEIYKGSEQEFWDYECSCLENVPDGSYLYGTISTFLGSDKEASEWLHSMGYAGLRFPGHNANTGEKFMNYVIFDTNDVKIKKKTPNTD